VRVEQRLGFGVLPSEDAAGHSGLWLCDEDIFEAGSYDLKVSRETLRSWMRQARDLDCPALNAGVSSNLGIAASILVSWRATGRVLEG